MSSAVATAENIRSTIDHGPVRPVQVSVVVLCALLTMIDGFDVLVMAFTAPPIAEAPPSEPAPPPAEEVLEKKRPPMKPTREVPPAEEGTLAGRLLRTKRKREDRE